VSDAPEERPLLLVCSCGGHLLQLLALEDAWRPFPHTWVTLDRSDARSLLEGEDVQWAFGPTNRSIKNLFRNLALARRVLRDTRPFAVLTTGAGVAVPFAWLARFYGARVVYVESVTRIERLSLSGRLIHPVASRMYVQWPELAEPVIGARYSGTVLSAP
jgi:UDP-N-acetylglucosamine:LPS N-acetylglucosamine transferase